MNYDHRAMAEYQVTIADLNSKLAAANAEIADLRENLCMSETTIKTLMHINCKNMEKINNLKKPNDSSKVFVLTDPQRNPEDILKIIDLPIPVHFLFNLYSCETTGCI
jgi:5S rRNA maturation endonuclease (ribonuclease M5)